MTNKYRHRRPPHGDRSGALIAVLILAAVAVISAIAVFFLSSRTGDPPTGSQTEPVSGPYEPGVSSEPAQQPDTSSGPARQPGSASEPARQPDVSSAPPEVREPYDFAQPVPEGEAVDNSYFDDAAFVGDSRTDGFMIYSGIGTGENLTSNGLSVFSLPTKKALTIGGEKYTLLEALALKEYGKVYLSLGINELGYYNDEGFYNSYGAAIDEIRKLQPNAVIYIQGLIPLNEGRIQETNGNKYHLTNEHLQVYNGLLMRLAEEKQVAYLDLYTRFVDENGELPEEASRDGVHLTKEYCQRWLTYLQAHTVDFDTLYPDGPPAVGETGPEAERADRSEEE